MHKSKGTTKARKAHTSTLREIIYTDTKKDDSSLSDEQEAFWISVLREWNNFETWKVRENCYPFVLH